MDKKLVLFIDIALLNAKFGVDTVEQAILELTNSNEDSGCMCPQLFQRIYRRRYELEKQSKYPFKPWAVLEKFYQEIKQDFIRQDYREEQQRREKLRRDVSRTVRNTLHAVTHKPTR